MHIFPLLPVAPPKRLATFVTRSDEDFSNRIVYDNGVVAYKWRRVREGVGTEFLSQKVDSGVEQR